MSAVVSVAMCVAVSVAVGVAVSLAASIAVPVAVSVSLSFAVCGAYEAPASRRIVESAPSLFPRLHSPHNFVTNQNMQEY